MPQSKDKNNDPENPLKNLDFFIQKNKDENKKMIYKTDCEGCEWQVILNIPDSQFQYIDFIIGEFHHLHTSLYLLEQQVQALEKLTQFYYIYYLKQNNYAKIILTDGYMIPTTVEMGLIRKQILD